jgi:hypothetical protein
MTLPIYMQSGTGIRIMLNSVVDDGKPEDEFRLERHSTFFVVLSGSFSAARRSSPRWYRLTPQLLCLAVGPNAPGVIRPWIGNSHTGRTVAMTRRPLGRCCTNRHYQFRYLKVGPVCPQLKPSRLILMS